MLKIGIVNDSLMAAECLRRVVNRVAAYQLLWVAYNGHEALRYCRQNCPDVILMDLIMPEMDGIEATRRISAEFSCAILVVTATVHGHAGRVFEAMGAGALDAVNTPVLGDAGRGEGEDILVRKINTIATLLRGKPLVRGASAPRPETTRPADARAPALIAIGASTGGPSALTKVLRDVPADLPAALAIVQHVDEQFMPSFINWLNDHTPLPVRAARPDIVYASINGFGQKGPDKDAPGFDATAWYARTGIMEELRPKDGPPVALPVGLGDLGTAATLASIVEKPT